MGRLVLLIDLFQKSFSDVLVQEITIGAILDVLGDIFHLLGREFSLEINAISLVHLAAIHGIGPFR